ncbi:NUDIX hydrolase [Gimesia maris]|uniref:GDP-mannose pyrophosphatase n=1 Tax=Gimesia maris TaxID=122 RepID=A0ABX5YR51_9PLAN|nr:NUDIX hydrolase [Gimesia maris]HAW30620.1 NUDIX hydrolase [Planctomycetaceae bacterium]EDL59586.1 MutT-like protein [Gimesia maris DSM 8797]QDU16025.1 ADP-ribose pyrophosphatase [Gimesia maris]QEG18052.1 ADP-ribose pyrophosphatase [Gimesia maris]QGQ28928.1 NUDIX hydrolase [Gimesia maris]|tara:strand:- start:2629 stop:3180 length:552 start_codon:yes stop_codon:yes gene_type:complete
MSEEGQDSDQTIIERRFIRLIQRGRWEFVQRVNTTGVVCLFPLTVDQRVIFVEQFRPPVDATVIEFPAGLAGDIAGQEEELLETAAARELLEETGYQAGQMVALGSTVSSAGLTDEAVEFFLALDLQKVGAGGGDESEKITVHAVPFTEIEDWLDHARQRGCLLDARIYAGLYFITKHIQKNG